MCTGIRNTVLLLLLLVVVVVCLELYRCGQHWGNFIQTFQWKAVTVRRSLYLHDASHYSRKDRKKFQKVYIQYLMSVRLFIYAEGVNLVA